MWAAHEGMGWWMLFGGVFWILFIGALVYVFSSDVDRGTGNSQPRPETPLEVAKRRIAAASEISTTPRCTRRDPVRARTSLTAVWPRSRLRHSIHTRPPRAASASEVSKPIPELAPVTRHTRPARFTCRSAGSKAAACRRYPVRSKDSRIEASSRRDIGPGVR